ncbi:MAG: phosphatase PAP2 family protein [Actinomycetota bacterium]
MITSRSHDPTSSSARPLRAVFLSAASLAIGLASSTSRGRALDADAFHELNGHHSAAADALFGGVTELGAIVASVAAAGVIAMRGRPRTALRGLGAAGVTSLAGQGLKKAFGRPRPWEAHPDSARLVIDGPTSTSWPSSHPAVLLAFLTVVSRDLGLSCAARGALWALVGGVGVSRVYLGVHFPSDVVGGVLLGRAVGLAWPGAPGTPAAPAARSQTDAREADREGR